MTSVLVMQADPLGRAAFADALRRAGFEVHERSDTRASPAEIARSQVAVVDLDLAIASGWLRPLDPVAPPGVPLVVASAFATFLSAVRGRVAATVLLPATAAAIVSAVESAVSGHRAEPTVADEDPLASPERATRLASCNALDGGTDFELFAIADLVSRGVGLPIGLVSVVSADRQTFIAHVGLPPDMLIARGTPRSWSFCQHAVLAGQPLVVPDAREHPVLAALPPVEMGLVRAYAGVPVRVGDCVIGTVCVMSPHPREFNASDIATLELGARLVSARLAARPAEATTQAAPQPSPGVVSVGELLDDKYWISARLGDGGQSQVFLARDRRSGQLVAVKVVRDASGSETLAKEAATLARVRHPNIVQLHATGRTGDGAFYLVLEYVEGKTLGDRLSELRGGKEPMPLAQATTIIRELAGALTSLHATGLVHGDVKPSNVLLDVALDRSVLIDFGIGLEQRASAKGALGGTPGFSAPEQLSGGEGVTIGPRLDVYALAAIAYALLVSEGPFAASRRRERLAAQSAGTVTPPSERRSGLSPDVDRLLLASLSPRPEDRPASVLEFAEAFEEAIRRSAPDDEQLVPSSATTPRSRGIAFRAYRTEVARQFGAAEDARAFAAIDPVWRAVFDEAVHDDELYPAMAFVAYLGAFAGSDLSRLDRLGASVAMATIPDALRAMHVTRTPETLLTILDPLLHRFHHWGKVDARVATTGSAVVTLGLPAGFAPVMCRYLGGLLRAVLGMVGREATIEHTACASSGAPACLMEITWK